MKTFSLIFYTLVLCLSSFGYGLDQTPSKILIVGGAGYIGSHINEMLFREGHETVVLDNLSTGNKKAVRHGIFIEGDLTDTLLLDHLFETYPIKAVMHFAAYKDVGESTRDPLKYYTNNVTHSLNLLSSMIKHGVKHLIFSSSATIFGFVENGIVTEHHPCHPINPYGQTKWMVENILQDFDRAYGLRFCALRYFNAAGGDPEGVIKNYKTKESNLIPILLQNLKQQKEITIFGTDYPTPDGTCIRDYIHIDDLGRAHIKGMERLLSGGPSACYNLGNGQGYSVREVIAATEKVTGLKVKFKEGPRRLGDPAILITSNVKAQNELQWIPNYPSLETMIEHAWKAME